MATEFAGEGLPMSADGMTNGCDRLGVKAAEIWAVLTVETMGSGFLPDRRPQILFERHIFRRETDGAFDRTAPEVSNPAAGGNYNCDSMVLVSSSKGMRPWIFLISLPSLEMRKLVG